MRRWCASSTRSGRPSSSGLPPARGQVDSGLDRRRQALCRHRFRPRLADRFGLPAHHQALDARHTAQLSADGVRRRSQRRGGERLGGPHPGFERTCSRAPSTSTTRTSLSCRAERRHAASTCPATRRGLLAQRRRTRRHAARTAQRSGRADATLPARLAARQPTRRPTWRRREFQVLFTPTATRSLAGFTTTRAPRARQRARQRGRPARRVASQADDRPGHGFTRREVEAPFPGTLSAQRPARPAAAPTTRWPSATC